jgi:hypothetical protein
MIDFSVIGDILMTQGDTKIAIKNHKDNFILRFYQYALSQKLLLFLNRKRSAKAAAFA